jgi:SAM-dependent methyltransferase
MTQPICPICRSTRFRDFNGRPKAQCEGCGALERGRYLWMVLERRFPDLAGRTIAHFAPERFLMDRLGRRTDLSYRAFDLHPEHYRHDHVAVERLDLCSGLAALAPRSFDLILHSHVLEHLPCDVVTVLRQMAGLLRPGGSMMFSIPIDAEHSREGVDEAKTEAEREMRRRQGEHLRVFGKRDVVPWLEGVLGADCLVRQAELFTPEELAAAAVPVSRREPTGKSVFIYTAA